MTADKEQVHAKGSSGCGEAAAWIVVSVEVIRIRRRKTKSNIQKHNAALKESLAIPRFYLQRTQASLSDQGIFFLATWPTFGPNIDVEITEGLPHSFKKQDNLISHSKSGQLPF